MKRTTQRSMRRLLIRFSLLSVIVVCGAIAIGQAQRGLEQDSGVQASSPTNEAVDGTVAPIAADPQRETAFADQSMEPVAVVDHGFLAVGDESHESASQAAYTQTTYQRDAGFAPIEDTTNEVYDSGTGDTSQYIASDVDGETQSEAWDDGFVTTDDLPPLVDEPNSDEGHYSDVLIDDANAYVPEGVADTDGTFDASSQTESGGLSPVPTDEFVEGGAEEPPIGQFAVAAGDMGELPAPKSEELSLPPLNDEGTELQPLAELPDPTDDASEFEFSPASSQTSPPEGAPPIDDGNGFDDFPSPHIPPDDSQDEYQSQPPNLPTTPANSLTPTTVPNQESLNGDSQANGRPGPAEMEGPQTATLTIEKSAPEEIQVNQPATITIKVRNVGSVPANDVLIRDEVPHGSRILSTEPRAGQASNGGILWQMGSIKPGDEVTATMEILPLIEGQIGSVATASFQASASSRSVATKPLLELVQSAPREVLIGQDVKFTIQISNPGSGSATNVVLEEDVPDGLSHSAGKELEHEVGDLKPGETRELELTLKADKPGPVENVIIARADGGLSVEQRARLQIVAPQLKTGIRGPAKRYLDRRAKFQISVSNPGTASAENVDLVAHLPKGLTFVNTTNSGLYNQQTHSIRWSLDELPAGEVGTVELLAKASDMGRHKIRVEGSADMELSDAAEANLEVEGLAALLFTVADLSDPIEIGGQTTYEIRVVNQGSKAATGVKLAAQLPQGLRAVGGEGPTRELLGQGKVGFDPLPRLNPKAEVTFKVHVEGTAAGDQRFRVYLSSAEMQEPVVKEESTRVYSDE